MSKHRKDARIDENQPEIVDELRMMGYSVHPGVDDIFVAYKGVNLWVEIKTMDVWLKSGGMKKDSLKPSQIALLRDWQGPYMVAWTTEQIDSEMKRLIKLYKT